jgi:hypothetical protein
MSCRWKQSSLFVYSNITLHYIRHTVKFVAVKKFYSTQNLPRWNVNGCKKSFITLTWRRSWRPTEVLSHSTDSTPSTTTPTQVKTRESSLKGKDQYSWPPRTNWFRSAAFNTEDIYVSFLQNKLSSRGGQLYWEPSPSVKVLWLRLDALLRL